MKGRRFLSILLLVWIQIFGHWAYGQDKPTGGETPAAGSISGPSEAAVPMTDIHGIKPPEPAGWDPTPMYCAAAGALVVTMAVFSFFLWKYRRRRLRGGTVPQFSPEETALAALDELSEAERMDGKLFYFRMSAVLRRYIQARYGVYAPEMTTEELLPAIKPLDIDPDLKQGLRSLLKTADPIKYAGSTASVRTMKDHLAFARRFVKETIPAPAQEA